MSETVREGRHVLRLPDDVEVERLDETGRVLPKGMSFVDFVLTDSDRTVLLELKDPAAAPDQHRATQIDTFLKQVKSHQLVDDHLVPKTRDSYTFLHLMERDPRRPTLCVVLLGFALEPALLLRFKERLARRLRQEANVPWRRPYVDDCLVLDAATWPRAFPDWALDRDPSP
ncbi:MAG: hypothetical protein AAGC60_07010 [Acidobacteriota bacterium]